MLCVRRRRRLGPRVGVIRRLIRGLRATAGRVAFRISMAPKRARRLLPKSPFANLVLALASLTFVLPITVLTMAGILDLFSGLLKLISPSYQRTFATNPSAYLHLHGPEELSPFWRKICDLRLQMHMHPAPATWSEARRHDYWDRPGGSRSFSRRPGLSGDLDAWWAHHKAKVYTPMAFFGVTCTQSFRHGLHAQVAPDYGWVPRYLRFLDHPRQIGPSAGFLTTARPDTFELLVSLRTSVTPRGLSGLTWAEGCSSFNGAGYGIWPSLTILMDKWTFSCWATTQACVLAALVMGLLLVGFNAASGRGPKPLSQARIRRAGALELATLPFRGLVWAPRTSGRAAKVAFLTVWSGHGLFLSPVWSLLFGCDHVFPPPASFWYLLVVYSAMVAWVSALAGVAVWSAVSTVIWAGWVVSAVFRWLLFISVGRRMFHVGAHPLMVADYHARRLAGAGLPIIRSRLPRSRRPRAGATYPGLPHEMLPGFGLGLILTSLLALTLLCLYAPPIYL